MTTTRTATPTVAQPLWSYTDALDVLANIDARRVKGAGDGSSNGAQSFTLTDSTQHAARLMRDGWPEGTAAMLAVRASVPSPDRMPEWTHDVAGELPDVAAFCAGDPAHMWRADTEHGSAKPRPVVTLGLPLSYSCGTDTGTPRAVGAALLGLVDLLETTGTACRIVGYMWITLDYDDKKRGFIPVLIKDHTDTVDTDRLAFALGHPSMLRRLIFALMETDKRFNSVTAPGGYGTPRADLPDAPDAFGGEGAIILPTIGSTYAGKAKQVTPATARDVIAGVLREAGVIVPDSTNP